jgi:hypothetical protein
MAAKTSAGTIMKQDRSGMLHLAPGQRDKPHQASIHEEIRVFEQQELVARRALMHGGHVR